MFGFGLDAAFFDPWYDGYPTYDGPYGVSGFDPDGPYGYGYGAGAPPSSSQYQPQWQAQAEPPKACGSWSWDATQSKYNWLLC